MRQLTLATDHSSLTLSSRIQQHTENKGSLTEMILTEGSAIQPMHLLPILAQCASQQRWLTWLSTSMPMNKEYLAAAGLADSPVIHLDICSKNQLQRCCKVLAAANSHVLIEWHGELEEQERQTILKHAHHSGSHIVLIQYR